MHRTTLSFVISIATLIDLSRSSYTIVNWHGKEVLSDLVSTVIGVLGHGVSQVVAESNTLVPIDQEHMACVKHKVVNVGRLLKLRHLTNSHLPRHLPLTLYSHWVVVGDQQISWQFDQGLGPEFADSNSHDSSSFRNHDFISFSQFSHSDLLLSLSLLVDNVHRGVLAEAVVVCWFRSRSVSFASGKIFAGSALG